MSSGRQMVSDVHVHPNGCHIYLLPPLTSRLQFRPKLLVYEAKEELNKFGARKKEGQDGGEEETRKKPNLPEGDEANYGPAEQIVCLEAAHTFQLPSARHIHRDRHSAEKSRPDLGR
ncbi:unnamed protein product [Protopolystoma xenopodis]|uniref:Uncharacterized protein n=1 Tax=Protopolystoma xenopodis TaxID=117903 RepID=A0A448X2E9_9PLAT|nr:unnamed protein product [Protopolystoma xenopodis]